MLVWMPYEREKAVLYAKRWAFGRNPLFLNFDGLGGDCTNFVSQCLYAGCCVMNETPDTGWYYNRPEDRAAAWTGVPYLYTFLTGVRSGAGPFARETGAEGMEPGDVVQLCRSDGVYYHTMLVLRRANGEIYVAAHAEDACNRPLSSYRFSGVRFLHIGGVRLEIPASYRPDCFRDLYDGRESFRENLDKQGTDIV